MRARPRPEGRQKPRSRALGHVKPRGKANMMPRFFTRRDPPQPLRAVAPLEDAPAAAVVERAPPQLPLQKRIEGAYAIEPWRLECEDDVATAARAVASGAATWHATPDATRVAALQDIKARAVSVCPGLSAAVASTIGYESKAGVPNVARGAIPAMGTGLLVARMADELIALLNGTAPQPPPALRCTAAGAEVFKVWPLTKSHQQDFGLGKAAVEMYTQPSRPSTRRSRYEVARSEQAAGAAVVLGAGNQPFLSITDSICKLFVHQEPVILKHHDEQAAIAPYVEYILEPLRKLGVYAGITCNVEHTVQLVQRPEVTSVHMTGGRKTHDAIVWGATKDEQQQRKEAGRPLLQKPMTSELGSCSPILVSPGHWTAKEIAMRGRNIAQNLLLNAGCNCLAPRLVLLPDEWHQTEQLIEAIRTAARDTYPNPAWYPNTAAAVEDFEAHHDNIERVLPSKAGLDFSAPVLPLIISHVAIDSAEDLDAIPACQREIFGPCFVIARLRHSDHLPARTLATLAALKSRPASAQAPAALTEDEQAAVGALRTAYLERAVPLVNGHLGGNLVATLFSAECSPDRRPPEVQRAVDALEYGSVVVNGLAVLPYTVATGMWGGFQGEHTSTAEPQSGVGVVNNLLLFDYPQKQALWLGFEQDLNVDVAMPAWLAKLIVALVSGGPRGVLQALRT